MSKKCPLYRTIIQPYQKLFVFLTEKSECFGLIIIDLICISMNNDSGYGGGDDGSGSDDHGNGGGNDVRFHFS